MQFCEVSSANATQNPAMYVCIHSTPVRVCVCVSPVRVCVCVCVSPALAGSGS